jgi:hypothetical protein
MASVTRDANASIDASTAMFAAQITGLIAGENLVIGPCYVKAADGKVYMSNGTAANEAAKFDGFAARAALAGQPVTLYGVGTRIRYGNGLTPGADYFVDTVAGGLADAATTGGTTAIARAVDTTDIRVTRNTNT